MEKVTKQIVYDSGVSIPYCKYGKLTAVLQLSNEEQMLLKHLKESKDFVGIEDFFTGDEKYNVSHLHYINFKVIENTTDILHTQNDVEDPLLIFAPHAFRQTTVIAVVIGRYVFEFTPKIGCKKFFVGDITQTLYAVCRFNKVKPIEIYTNR